MKINIFYGGRGVIGDPTTYVIKKMIGVFEELNVSVEKYDLYDQKNNITLLPQSLKETDGIILASTVEWHGIGGYMNTFLDACWLYGDKEKIQKIYMAPVIMSTTYGEKEAELDLINAWESLGGMTAPGLTGYIPDVSLLEQNESYNLLIEKTVENIYRTVSRKEVSLPVSTKEVTLKINKSHTGFLTQQETEQLSEYISDDAYVSKQKEDIKALADMFKGKLRNAVGNDYAGISERFTKAFKPVAGTRISYKIVLKDTNVSVGIKIDNSKIEINEGNIVDPGITLSLSDDVLSGIFVGRKTFQGGFMDGSINVKGDFAGLRLLDDMFPFMAELEKA